MYSLLSDGTALDINNLPFDLNGEVTYPLEIRAEGCENNASFNGQASLEMTESRNIPDEWAIIVRDTQTNEEFDLRADEPFTFDLASETDCSSKRVVQVFLIGDQFSEPQWRQPLLPA